MSRLAIALATIAILSAPLALAAESPEDAAFAKQVIGRAPGKAPAAACFIRVYDDAHLAGHPRQNVRAMRMLVSTSLDDDSGRQYELRLGVTFRNSRVRFETQGNCGSIHGEGNSAGRKGVVHCGVDCDGGAIDVGVRDANSMRVSIPDGARLWRAGTDAETGGRRNFGSDDKLFRLDRAPIGECLSLAGNASERKRLGVDR